MDITIELLAAPKTHALNDAAKEARRYRRGDVVEVFLRSEITEPPSPSSPFIFIHITNVPENKTFAQIKEIIMQPVLQPLAVDPEIYRRRKFRVLISELPQIVQNILTADKEITVSWAQAKNYLRKKNVTTFLDQSTDDETQFITDTDMA